jgi:LPS-assembly lipoprotein
MSLRHNLILLSLALLCACGFELRGSNLEPLKQSKIYVSSSGANMLAREIKGQLQFADVKIAHTAKDADYILDISDEKIQRKVLSISGDTGKVEEYELLYEAIYSVRGPGGKTLVKSEPVTAQRDYVFVEDAVLGKSDEENKLREEMRRQSAASVLRRLRTVIQ